MVEWLTSRRTAIGADPSKGLGFEPPHRHRNSHIPLPERAIPHSSSLSLPHFHYGHPFSRTTTSPHPYPHSYPYPPTQPHRTRTHPPASTIKTSSGLRSALFPVKRALFPVKWLALHKLLAPKYLFRPSQCFIPCKMGFIPCKMVSP